MTRITTDSFTGMITIFADDDYSQQAICLTPAEARQLRDQLTATDLGDYDPFEEREAGHLRLLTLYNVHSLPSIDRAGAAAHLNLIGPRFHFELWQVFEDGERRQVSEL